MLLLVASTVIAWEAASRFSNLHLIATGPVAWIASIGIAVNGFTAWLFVRGGKADLNVRSAYLQMVADAAVYAGVVVSALVMGISGWRWLDSVTGLVIAWSSWQLWVDSLHSSLDAVPPHVNAEAVVRYLASDPHVKDTCTTCTLGALHRGRGAHGPCGMPRWTSRGCVA